MAISTTIPTYRQLNPAGFWSPDATLIMEGEAFEYEGEPNYEMEALNEPAQLKLKTFFDKIEAGRKDAEENVLPEHRNLNDLPTIGEATSDARRISLEKGQPGIPLMSNRVKSKEVTRTVQLPKSDVIVRTLTSTGR
jgi:hypothetical protein